MAMRFPENYLTTLNTRAPARIIEAELAALTDIVGAGTSETAAQRKLLAIESHLAAAQEHFLKRRFAAAIDEYKTAQAMIYGLLNKRFHPGVSKFPGIRLPLERKLFKPLLDAAGEILEALPLPPVDPDFGPVFGTPVDTVVSATVPYESLGLKRVDELPQASGSVDAPCRRVCGPAAMGAPLRCTSRPRPRWRTFRLGRRWRRARRSRSISAPCRFSAARRTRRSRCSSGHSRVSKRLATRWARRRRTTTWARRWRSSDVRPKSSLV